jgi:hypothetical protein
LAAGEVKVAGALVGMMVFGWSLVAAADARHELLEPTRVTRVLSRTVPVEVEPSPVETPHADRLVDWADVERQTECLWEFLRAHGVELTLATVVAAGDWTDALGGACLVIGEDDE